MGMLYDDESTDRSTVLQVCTGVAHFWNTNRKIRLTKGIDIEVTPDEELIERGSKDGSKIFQESIFKQHFDALDCYHRVACLIVVGNLHGFFNLSKSGQVYTNLEGRRWFLARFNTLLLPVAFWTLDETHKRNYSPFEAWSFASIYLRDQFILFSNHMHRREAGGKKDKTSMEIEWGELAHDVLGCSLILNNIFAQSNQDVGEDWQKHLALYSSYQSSVR